MQIMQGQIVRLDTFLPATAFYQGACTLGHTTLQSRHETKPKTNATESSRNFVLRKELEKGG